MEIAISDISDANFTVTASAATPTTPVVVVPTPSSTTVATPSWNGTSVGMTVPGGKAVTLTAGNLFRGVALSGVYLVKADGTRSVFPNEAVFFSYYPDFKNVVQVSDDQLRKLPLGRRVVTNAGSLVKIQSDPKVYQVAAGGVLRHVPDESTAIKMFGATWNKKISDVRCLH